MVKAGEEHYELVMFDGRIALFTNDRIDRASVPEHLYCYDVRHDDECRGIACEIKANVLVNHWGTILTKQKIPLQEDNYYLEKDLNYFGYAITLSEYENMNEGQIEEMVLQKIHSMQMM